MQDVSLDARREILAKPITVRPAAQG